MNTYAIQPTNPFIPVFHIKARTAGEALSKATIAVQGIWQVRPQDIN